MKANRNFVIENRITQTREYDRIHQTNSYGGMGMDSISGAERALRNEEISYMNAHPEIYRRAQFNNPSAYLIPLE